MGKVKLLVVGAWSIVFVIITVLIVIISLGITADEHGEPEQLEQPLAVVTDAELLIEENNEIDVNNKIDENNRIDEIVKQMTVAQKVGQMLMADIPNQNGKRTTTLNEHMVEIISEYHVGGVILFKDNIINQEQVIRFTDQLQSVSSKTPMFIAIDQEGGKVNRIAGGTSMPGNMTLGATRSEELAYAVGKALGTEVKALGMNVNFAPVLDVNSNPLNPVIGTRSFGSDPQAVSNLGIQYTKGIQEVGVIATAKHFPGHGDTYVDSHVGLPVLLHDQERLHKVELAPFREVIASGIDMIMTAHVMFPTLGGSVPATLSYRVLTELLRDELGFQGVIVTDAFNMKAITDHYGEKEAVVKAIEAGADIILMPKDVKAAHNAIVKAVESGRITEARIDQSVTRILAVKYKYGIEKKQEANDDNENNAHLVLEQKVAEKGVTLVKNENKLLPFALAKDQEILLLAPEQTHIKLMTEALKQMTEGQELNLTIREILYRNPQELETLSERDLANADYILLGTKNLNEEIDLPFLQNSKVVVIALENPYDLMYVANAQAYIAVYGAERANVTAGLKVAFGQLNPQGKLPVAIPNLLKLEDNFKIGHGLSY